MELFINSNPERSCTLRAQDDNMVLRAKNDTLKEYERSCSPKPPSRGCEKCDFCINMMSRKRVAAVKENTDGVVYK
jgi:hypothetical protein